MRRGEVWWADLPRPLIHRPVLIITRDSAITVRDASYCCAHYSHQLWHIPVEVATCV